MTNTPKYKDHFGREFVRGDWILCAQSSCGNASIRVARVKGFYPKAGLRVTETELASNYDYATKQWIQVGMKVWDCTFRCPDNCVIIDPGILPNEYVDAYLDWEPDAEE